MRSVVLDTETTGLNPKEDRIIEIGCVELMHDIQTGNIYQAYINPEMQVSQGAFAVAGISNEFLIDKPLFRDVADDFLDFIRNDTLIIHNAKFDIAFLNMELEKLSKPTIHMDRVIDTLILARKSFPGSPASLDALCKRFSVDASSRDKHGAVIDSILLAEVFVHLTGGKQSGLSFEQFPNQEQSIKTNKKIYKKREFPPTPEEIKAHSEFMCSLSSN